MFGRESTLASHPGTPGSRRWFCRLCGWVFDEALGDLEHGIAPGTTLEDLPADWRCPECGAGRAEFEPFLE
jgi:rubredoxin